MDNLTDICAAWLDNANLDIKISTVEDRCKVALIFYVVGMQKKVVMNCSNSVKFSVEQPDGQLPFYMVLKTKVARKNKVDLCDLVHADFYEALKDELWHVNVSEGDVRVNVVSEELNWSVEEITEEELRWFQ